MKLEFELDVFKNAELGNHNCDELVRGLSYEIRCN